jgi:hypothetical protein
VLTIRKRLPLKHNSAFVDQADERIPRVCGSVRYFLPTVFLVLGCVNEAPQHRPQPDASGPRVPPEAVADSGVTDGGGSHGAPAPQMWPMPNAPGFGLPHEQQYEVISEDLALDAVTGLMWHRAVEPRFFSWEDALAHCGELELGGYDDWRLPSRLELVSILSLGFLNPSINRAVFPDTPSDWYWTSTESAELEEEAWFVYFYLGSPNLDRKDNVFSVRCVRSEVVVPSLDPNARFESTDTTVRDLWTGLLWQRYASAEAFTFEAASRH